MPASFEVLDTYKNKPPVPTVQENDVAVLMSIVYKMIGLRATGFRLWASDWISASDQSRSIISVLTTVFRSSRQTVTTVPGDPLDRGNSLAISPAGT